MTSGTVDIELLGRFMIELREQQQRVWAALEKIHNDVLQLHGDAGLARTKLAAHDARFDALEARMTALEGRVATLETKVELMRSERDVGFNSVLRALAEVSAKLDGRPA